MDDELKVKLSPKSYFAYLKVLGTSFFNLTDSERKCLGHFMELQYDFNEKHPFSHDNKKKVAKAMNYDSLNTINVYIKKLKDKGAIVETDSGYALNPNLKPFAKISITLNW